MGKQAVNFLFVIAFLTCNIYAQSGDIAIKSKINNKILKASSGEKAYTFFAGGHLYGYPSPSLFVSPSLLVSIDEINKNNPDFFISLGDNFRTADSLNINDFKKYFADRINCPVFISVGNHDVSSRNVYNVFFGDTWYSYMYNNDMFVFLDSEIDNGSVTGSQLEFLEKTTDEVVKNPAIRNVFIFCHRLIWSVSDSAFNVVYENTNAVDGYPLTDNFSKVVFPLLKKMSENKKLYFLSGDIGVTLPWKRWGFQVLYHKLNNTNITYVANGIGDNENDVILKIDVDKAGEASFSLFPLTGKQWDNIEKYNVEFWNEHFKGKPIYKGEEPDKKEKVVDKSLFSRIYRLITHIYFLIGIALGVVILLVVCVVYLRLKK